MYKLIISESANEDLDRIITYIVNNLCNPSAATSLLNEIEARYLLLLSNPKIYELCQDPRLAIQGYRKAVIKNYAMIYRIDEVEKTIGIIRFFYSAMDFVKLI